MEENKFEKIFTEVLAKNFTKELAELYEDKELKQDPNQLPLFIDCLKFPATSYDELDKKMFISSFEKN